MVFNINKGFVFESDGMIMENNINFKLELLNKMVVSGYLIRPKISLINAVSCGFKKVLKNENEQIYLQIYVPEIVVLGQFIKIGRTYNLNSNGVCFQNTKEVLNLYKERLKNNEIKVVKEINFVESELEEIIENAKIYRKVVSSIRNRSLEYLN
ncbi:MAG: hypothetical protein KC550_00990 [Nanoarchaeota archaeon]|nr:hypothetical protein [Nanoarchaeota archaeon]